MSKRSNKLLLEDILQSAKKIQQYTSNQKFESFIENEILIDAVLRNFAIIGEAANKLGEDYKIVNNDLNWNRIIGLRNRVVHEYFGIDFNTIWKIIETYIPSLVIEIEKLINE